MSSPSGQVTLRLSTPASGIGDPPNSAFEFAFEVTAELEGGNSSAHRQSFPDYVSHREVTFTIRGLEDGFYRFQARASNIFGESEESGFSDRIEVGGKIPVLLRLTLGLEEFGR